MQKGKDFEIYDPHGNPEDRERAFKALILQYLKRITEALEHISKEIPNIRAGIAMIRK